jgi:hypothetical protein
MKLQCPAITWPLVLVEEDSRQPVAAWRYLSDIGEPQAVQCRSVGWLVYDGEDTKALCQNLGDPADVDAAQGSEIIAISTRCIRTIETLTSSSMSACGPNAVSTPTLQSS